MTNDIHQCPDLLDARDLIKKSTGLTLDIKLVEHTETIDTTGLFADSESSIYD